MPETLERTYKFCTLKLVAFTKIATVKFSKFVNLLRFIVDITKYPIYLIIFVIWVIYNFFSFINPVFDFISSIPAFFYITGVVLLYFTELILRVKPKYIINFTLCLLFLFNIGLEFNNNNIFQNSDGKTLKICSLNTKYYFDYVNSKEEALKKLKDLNCDVYTFSEIWGVPRYELLKNLIVDINEKFPEHIYYSRNAEFVTFSKYNIKETKVSYYEGFLRTDIEFEGKLYSVYNVHIWNPLFGRQHFRFNEKLSEEKKSFSAYKIRKMQIEELVADINSEGENNRNTVITGDFNSMPHHKITREKSYGRKIKRLNYQGISFTRTFNTEFRAIRIDYTFVSNNVKVLKYDIVCDKEISDHCMQVVQVN